MVLLFTKTEGFFLSLCVWNLVFFLPTFFRSMCGLFCLFTLLLLFLALFSGKDNLSHNLHVSTIWNPSRKLNCLIESTEIWPCMNEGFSSLCSFFPELAFNIFSSSSSSTRVHSPGRVGHGYPLPSQVWYGQDCRLCAGHPPADRACWWTGQCAGHVPHQRVGLPDLKGVREVLQVQPRSKGESPQCQFQPCVFKPTAQPSVW